MGGYHEVLGGVALQHRSAPAALTLFVGSASKERGRGLGASSILGSSRRDVACSGGSRQDGVCGKFRGSSAGRNSLRAVPSGTVGREGVSEGRSASSRKRSRRGGAHLNHPESGSLSLRILCSGFNLVPLWLSCLQVSKWVVQCSCLENPRDGGAWWAAVYGVAQSRTRLKRLSSSSSRTLTGASQVVLVVKNPPANAGDPKERHKFDPWVGKSPWNRKWHLIPVFLPGKFHGQRSLAGSAKSQTRVSDWEHTHTQDFNPIYSPFSEIFACIALSLIVNAKVCFWSWSFNH